MGKTAVPMEEIPSVLAALPPSKVQLWAYHPTLARLMFALEVHGRREMLYVLCSPLAEVRCPVRWESEGLKLSPCESGFELHDAKHGVVARAGGVIAFWGLGFDLPDDPFNGFLDR